MVHTGCLANTGESGISRMASMAHSSNRDTHNVVWRNFNQANTLEGFVSITIACKARGRLQTSLRSAAKSVHLMGSVRSMTCCNIYHTRNNAICSIPTVSNVSPVSRCD